MGTITTSWKCFKTNQEVGINVLKANIVEGIFVLFIFFLDEKNEAKMRTLVLVHEFF